MALPIQAVAGRHHDPKHRRKRVGGFVSLRGSAVTVLSFVVLGCSENMPSAPVSEIGPGAEFSGAPLTVVEVEFRLEEAKLIYDGSVRLFLRARCPVGFRVVEGIGSVYQGPVGQEIWGEGFFGARCDGFWHRTTVRVFAGDQRFKEGSANASVHLMVENDATGEFLEDSASRTVTIRRSLSVQ
jgi:hypothetical protein